MSATALFVTLEGIDGSGKSTQARRLAEALRARGHEVVLTREPGGSPGAEQIRALLLDGPPERWSPQTEILLFTAARRDHLERVIEPALSRGAVVICDRFADSTRVYQGLRGADLGALVDRLHALIIGREPDLTLLLDIDPQAGLGRAAARARLRARAGAQGESRFEAFGAPFQARLRQGFLDLARAHPQRFVVIDAARPAEAVARDVLAAVQRRLR
ncbi:MAG: dTMP kinase [Roseovarius sp.]